MPKTPTHHVYHVKNPGAKPGERTSGIWTKVGAAWAHKDGKGFDITLDLIPYSGRLKLREPRDKEDVVEIS